MRRGRERRRAPQTLEQATEEIARLRREVVRLQEREIILKIVGHPLRNARERYAQIKTMKGKHSVSVLCEVLAVSRNGYYRWRDRRPTPRQHEDEQLSAKIIAAHARSRRNYGAPRVVAELREEARRSANVAAPG